MYIIFIIAFIILAIVLTVIFVKNNSVFKNTLWHFKKCNVIVAGKKGSGKDLFFQKIINKRKEVYYGNIPYGGKHKKVKLIDYNIKDKENNILTYDNFLRDKIFKSKRKFIEGADHYISEGGVLLPSHMDSTLHKRYPSLPIYYALSRHLYNSNIHVNLQNFERLWKPLREQSDFFVYVHKTIKLPFILLTIYSTYDKYDSAVSRLSPPKTRILNKYSKAEIDIYKATNGDIRKGWICQLKKNVKYNTRYFETLLLKGPRKKQK